MKAKEVEKFKPLNMTTIKVRIDGLGSILFDKFKDHSKEIRPPEQKLYLIDGNVCVLPSEHLRSFLVRQNAPVGCVKKFEKKGAADYLTAAAAYVAIMPDFLPFLRENGEQIIFKDFKNGTFGLFESAPVTKLSGGGTIKQPAQPRPLLYGPWHLKFEITLIENGLIDEQKLFNWFSRGGLEVGLGNYRPRFGKFLVKEWQVTTA